MSNLTFGGMSNRKAGVLSALIGKYTAKCISNSHVNVLLFSIDSHLIQPYLVDLILNYINGV